MPINPTTMQEQVYPNENDIQEFKDFDISRESLGSFNERMSPKFHSVLFGMINTVETSDALPGEKWAERVENLRQQLSEVSTTKPSLEIWLSELIQNAMDAKWGDDVGASNIKIDFTETEITFWHDGRPPQHLGFQKNEVSKMVESGSTKRSDLNSEGRFGIGFKYWTYYFRNVSLSADGWSLGWNDKMNFDKISTSDINSGMQLVFSNPMEDCLTDLQQFQESLDQLFSRGLTRLVEGLSIQNTQINLSISTNGTEQFKLSHTVDYHKYRLPNDVDVKFFIINNELNNPQQISFEGYIPEILLGCDIKQFFGDIDNQSEVQNELIKALIHEFNPDLQNPSMEKILKAESEYSNRPWDSEENVRYSAQQQIHKLDTICMFDLSIDLRPHYELFSMFAIKKRFITHSWQNHDKEQLLSRIFFRGTYYVDRERTRLASYGIRNQSISFAQCHSANLLLHLLTLNDFRDKFDISEEIHKDILNSLDEEFLDQEYQTLLEGYPLNSGLNKFNVYPAVSWENGSPVQIFIPASKARPLRVELVEMINSDEPDARNWARSIIEPDEICFIEDGFESDGEFTRWSTFTPWHYDSENLENTNYDTIYETEVPELRVVEQITPFFEGTWPSWLPIPLKQGDEIRWISESDLRDSVVMRSTDEAFETFNDPFSQAIYEQARKLGMSSYYLAPGFENLIDQRNRIHTIPIEPPSEERLFELSVKKVVENNEVDFIRNLISKHPQCHTHWPVFVESMSGDLLMIEKPSSGWESTFFCMNDRFLGNEKSLWSYSKRGTNPEITPIIDSRNPQGTTSLFIKNLDDSTIFYSHLIYSKDGGNEYSQALNNIISEFSKQTDPSVSFSRNDYHYISNKQSNSLGNKLKLKIGVFNFLDGTSQETMEKVLSGLPPMPNILHALPMPKTIHESIDMPRFRIQRSDTFSSLYSTNLTPSSLGFARHIFNLVEDSSNLNNNNKDSLRRIPQVEIDLYYGEGGERSDEENKEDWMTCLSNYDEGSKNYSMIFRFISPALASLELLQNHQSQTLLRNSLFLSSFEGINPSKTSPLLKLDSKTSPNFQTWYAYVTTTPDDYNNQSQRLQIEKARVDSFGAAKGILNQSVLLSDDRFSDYLNRVGFSTIEDSRFLEQSLWGESAKPGEQTRYLEKLWSTKNSGEKQGQVIKMSISVMEELNMLPFSKKVLEYQEDLKENGQLYRKVQDSIENELQIQFLNFEDADESAELMISKWLFHPSSSSIDAVMRRFVRKCTGDYLESSRVIEAVWNRINNEFPNYHEQCLARLNNWIVIPHENWRGMVSSSFFDAIEKSKELTGNESLHSQINQAENYQEAMIAIENDVSRNFRFDAPATWRPLTSIEGSSQENIILTRYDSLFGIKQESSKIQSNGYGLRPVKSWFPLSNDEFLALQNKPLSKVIPTFVEDLILEHWEKEIGRFFFSGCQNFENNISVLESEDSISEKYSFLLDRIRWLMLSMPESPSEDRLAFLNSLPEIEIKETPTPDFDLETEDYSPILPGLTLGPCGWHMLFSDSKLTFYTSKPISEQLLADKFKMLSMLLNKVMSKFDIQWTDRKLTSRDFALNFGVDYHSICKVDPLVDFAQWFDQYNAGLIEPNQSFMTHLNDRKWSSVDGAESLLETLTNDANSWLSTGHLSASDVKPELLKMYDNGMTCTLPDFRTPFLSAAFGTDEAVRMTIVRLHSGPAQNPVGVLAENMNRADKIGSKIKNLGNTLLLSDNARARGAITNGWRLVAPLDSGYDNFLTYLKECWKELFVGESPDLERILLKGVVKHFSHDPDHDDYGNIVLHKLHILYILSFASVTRIEEVD